MAVLYAPDVVFIPDGAAAMWGVRLYIDDGATILRPMIRRRGSRLIGHTPIRTQLTWCRKEGVPQAAFTHCGSQIVADHRAGLKEVERLAKERGIEATIVYDGMELVLRGAGRPVEG